MARKKSKFSSKTRSKQLTKRYIDSYLNRNMQKAIRKLKGMKKSGTYMVSEKARNANWNLRRIYKKYGFDPEVLSTGKKFRNTITSLSELNTLYDSIREIMSINTRAELLKLRRTRSQFQDEGIDFDSRFKILQRMSIDFKEIFAFLSYSEASEIVDKGGNATSIMNAYIDLLGDIDLSNSKKQVYADRLNAKIKSGENLTPDELDGLDDF